MSIDKKIWEAFFNSLIETLETSRDKIIAPGQTFSAISPEAVFTVGNAIYRLQEPLFQNYADISEKLTDDNTLTEKASKQYVERTLEIIFHNIVTDHTNRSLGNADKYLEKLIGNITGRIRNWIYIKPLEGRWLDNGITLSLGNTSLLNKDAEELKHLQENYIDFVKKSEAIQDNLKSDWITYISAPFKFEGEFTYITAAVMAADPDFAIESGKLEAQRFLSTICLFQYLVLPDPNQIFIGMPSLSSLSSYPPAIALAPIDNNPAFSLEAPKHYDFNFKFNKSALEDMRMFGWERLEAIWAKDKHSEWEKILLNSAVWLGAGIADSDYATAFVRFTTVLEMLVCDKEITESITNKFAERTAFVLSEKSEKREYIWRKLKDLYSIRSKMLHSGSYDIEKDNLEAIRFYAIDCYQRLLKWPDEMRKKEEIISWCNKKKFESAEIKT